MSNYKQFDDENILIKSKPLTAKEQLAFSEFLKKEKAKVKARKVSSKSNPHKRKANA